MLEQYFNLIPIILISMLILYTENVAHVANSSLGKLIGISLIVYYTTIDIVYGVFMCALVVLYFHSDYVRNIGTIYTEPLSNMKTESVSVSEFKKQNCKNGILIHKEHPLNLEMLKHIYPDINFKYERCNPCFDTCDFSIVEEQLKATENLQPKTSDDFSINNVLDKISDFIPALWVKSEPFMLLKDEQPTIPKIK
jgi:hypothetical protein